MSTSSRMKTPDAIVVLAGGIRQDSSGRWRSTDLTPEDNDFSAPGGKLRVLAAALLADRYPEAVVVASGGRGYDLPADAPENRPPVAEILRDELIECGIPAGRITLETASNTTYGQLQELKSLAQKQGFRHVILVTNQWHMPRTEVLLEVKFPALQAQVGLVSAEGILLDADTELWGFVLKEAYASEWLLRRKKNEERGIAQIKEGTYRYRL